MQKILGVEHRSVEHRTTTSPVSTHRLGLMVLTILLFLTAALPASAHDYYEGTVGQHDQPFVTCYKTGNGNGRIAIQPNAVGLAGGPMAARYYIYAWQNGSWVHTYSTDHYTFEQGVSYEPVVLTVTSGYYTVTAEYWWHDGRAWSGQDRTTATTFTQAFDWSQNPIATPPPAPYQATTCEAG